VDRHPIQSDGVARLLLSVNGLAALVVGIVPGWLMALCQRAMQASL
jgi:NADH-quinone oxidoreductase subunit N